MREGVKCARRVVPQAKARFCKRGYVRAGRRKDDCDGGDRHGNIVLGSENLNGYSSINLAASVHAHVAQNVSAPAGVLAIQVQRVPLRRAGAGGVAPPLRRHAAVSYTPLTPPPTYSVQISVVAVSIKKQHTYTLL